VIAQENHSKEHVLQVKQDIVDMTTSQSKKKTEEATRAYLLRRDWLAFLKQVSHRYFNPLMPNKSGIIFVSLSLILL
jgi:hypothetical protein